MATLSLVLDKRRAKQDGTFPLVFLEALVNFYQVKLMSKTSFLF